MKRIIKLNERDLSRIVRRVVTEQKDDLRNASHAIDSYLEEMGGTLGSRNPKEIMENLKTLEWALKLAKNDVQAHLDHPNPKWDDEEMEDEEF